MDRELGYNDLIKLTVRLSYSSLTHRDFNRLNVFFLLYFKIVNLLSILSLFCDALNKRKPRCNDFGEKRKSEVTTANGKSTTRRSSRTVTNRHTYLLRDITVMEDIYEYIKDAYPVTTNVCFSFLLFFHIFVLFASF